MSFSASAVAQLALDLGKASFDNVYFSITTLQGIVEDRVSVVAHDRCAEASPVPVIVDEVIGLLRRTRKDFKETVDRCVSLLEEPLRSGPVGTGIGSTAARRVRLAVEPDDLHVVAH